MFRYLLLCLIVPLAAALPAQIRSGTIDYTEKYTFEFGDWMDKEQKERLEKMRAEGMFDRTGRLSFNDQAFSYTQLKDEAAAARGGWWARAQENPDIFYTSMTDSTVTDRRQVMDRSFVVANEWQVPEWNIANRKIGMKELPLPTQLATSISATGDTLTAYYTPSIPLAIGPRGYGGLPGAIVYLKGQKDGRTTEYTMKTMQPNAPVDLVAPNDNKPVTREEFDKEMKRATEMMERRRRSWERGRG